DAWPGVVCPEDREDLVERGGELACPRGHRWAVVSGVARMAGGGSYADAFGLQWNTYRRTQLDSYTGLPLSRERARRCLGEAAWSFLHRDPPVDVLEVGCGAGRFTEVLLSTRARVTSVDLSSAVDANRENFPPGDRHRILQADVRTLPFHEHQYDVVFCLGVIQHTPDPEETIARLYAQVKPGGWLAIDHYARHLSWYTKTAPLFRVVMKRLPPRVSLRWSRALVGVFFPLHRAARHSHAAQMVVSRISPVLSYYHSLPLPDDLQRQWALLDTHDSLTDWYKHFRSPEQIRSTLQSLGAVEIWCAPGGNGVEARCRRPARNA
ncbi:MAG TPA: class I SAM-dependent methyltransferase, partial [Candidatus Krumholzibacteria bacterium]